FEHKPSETSLYRTITLFYKKRAITSSTRYRAYWLEMLYCATISADYHINRRSRTQRSPTGKTKPYSSFGWKWPGGSCWICIFYWPWPGNTGQNTLILRRDPNNPRCWTRKEREKPHAHLRLHNACVVNRAGTRIMSHLVLTLAIIAVKSDKEPIPERRENEE